MNPDELQEILRRHGMWLRGEDSGEQADLSEADLSGENLRGASLSGADFSEANLSWADLRGANLSRTNLRGADLREANLRGASLRGADLHEADLRGAGLHEADLRWANLSEANLSQAIDGAVCRMDFGGWSICIRASRTSIGCQQYANEKWLAWSPDDVAFMHADARDWWAVHSEAIKAAIKCVMAKAAIKCVMEKAAKKKEAT